MRTALALLAVGLLIAGPTRAEPPRRTGTVDIDGVEVRAGHALAYPAVGQLRKGDVVIVVREEETGFLAIQPPPGSVSWIRQIHLGKVEPGENGKANVPVAVEAAEVMAGTDSSGKPTNRVTVRLPKGTIVETVGPALRVDNASWLPITPPEGDLRWIPKSALRAASLTALAPPPPYRPEAPAFTVSEGSKGDAIARPAVGTLPKVLTEHRLWADASAAEKGGEYARARSLYARIYQDLWDRRAERDAIVICYNRYTRCDEMVKRGDGAAERPGADAPRPAGSGKWSTPGFLQELQKVFVDGQQVYSLQDDRGNVIYYVTAGAGVNLKNYGGKRVQLYGVVAQRAELYRPHMAVERVELAK
jgi:hypothetical protein